jgi:electron transport complex protein RnfE
MQGQQMIEKIIDIFKDGLWKKNPGIVQLLGMCPLLAVTNTTVNALGLGLATIVVLTLSNLFVSLIRNLIIKEIRIMVYVIITASMVSSVQMLMEAFTPELYETLGLYIALIATNCIIIARAEMFATNENVFYSTLDGIANGLGFTLVLIVIGMCREFIGNGTLFGNMDTLFGEIGQDFEIRVFNQDKGFLISILPPGAFIALGLLVCIKNFIDKKYQRRKSFKSRQANTTKI